MNGPISELEDTSSESIGVPTRTVLLVAGVVLAFAFVAGASLDVVGLSDTESGVTADDADQPTEFTVLSALGTAETDDELTDFWFLLQISGQSDATDLADVTVEVTVTNETATLIYADSMDPAPGTEFAAGTPEEENRTLIDAEHNRGVIAFGLDEEIGPLKATEQMQIVVSTSDGVVADVRIESPRSIEAGDTVRLGEGADPRGSAP